MATMTTVASIASPASMASITPITPSAATKRQKVILQRTEIRRPQSRGWVPPNSRIPACIRNDAGPIHRQVALEVDALASEGGAAGDVVENVRAGGVEGRVGEADDGLAGAEEGVVDEGEDCGDDGAGGG